MHSHFCVAKVLGGFQQINMLCLTGPIHSALAYSPSQLSSLPGWKKYLVQRIPQRKSAQNHKELANQNLIVKVLINHN